jgi:hypothetical protein
MSRLLFVFISLLCSLNATAIVWRGTIIDADSKRPIQGASISNTTSSAVVITNELGQFDISGNEGDRVLFYCPGYRSETHIIIKGLEGIRLNFSMKLSSRELNEVIITQRYKTKYQKDSAERRSEQSRILTRQKSSIGSPVSFLAERLSRKQRAIFKFQKTFGTLEEQQFTDSRYTPELVASLTNLSADTLAHFMNSYPMPYDYARAATALELKMWIKYNFSDFLKKSDSLRQLKLAY